MRKLLIALLSIIILGCTGYHHYFKGELDRVKTFPEKYSHSVFLSKVGHTGNTMFRKQRSFWVWINTKILKFDDTIPKWMEFENIDKNIVIDSIWFSDSTDSFHKVLFPDDTSQNYDSDSRSLSFSHYYKKDNYLVREALKLPDSMSEIFLTVPYYSIVGDEKIYDTLTTVLDRKVIKYKYYIN